MTICGIGVDVIEIGRIRQAVERLGERFLRRIFTEAEQTYCAGFQDPYPHLAARFAAKEAAMKALGVGLWSGIPWTDFEVRNLPSGEPQLFLHSRAWTRANERGVTQVWVSLSHDRTAAVAVVVLVGRMGQAGK
ncbi:MAG: holo-ACP synthase [Acidobacteria bacterium]|nr:holo-ACP synthase [Acidobacteriota bacterium]MDW7984240.1 holo-ACP synthase [Acidobacteriota bacterium]